MEFGKLKLERLRELANEPALTGDQGRAVVRAIRASVQEVSYGSILVSVERFALELGAVQQIH